MARCGCTLQRGRIRKADMWYSISFLSRLLLTSQQGLTSHHTRGMVRCCVQCRWFDGVSGLGLRSLQVLIFLDWNKIIPVSFFNIRGIRKYWIVKWMPFCLLTFGRLQIDYGSMKHVSLGFTALQWQLHERALQPSWKGHECKPAQTQILWRRRGLRGEHMTTAQPHVPIMGQSSNEKFWLWPGC